MRFSYRNEGVCSSKVEFDYDGKTVSKVEFFGGCDGNLKAVSKLVDGMSPDEISGKLAGNTCGFKRTSCADQLAKAVQKAKSDFLQK